jgi:hypothetical protein
VSIERIIVQVDALNDDVDYEVMAEKVGNVLKKEMLKMMPVGGIMM